MMQTKEENPVATCNIFVSDLSFYGVFATSACERSREDIKRPPLPSLLTDSSGSSAEEKGLIRKQSFR
ncbi:hypothetical protein OPV22_027566 [Ensete ventricosum]|uniref:Uncharacterized protein n=1 Tax=Ensete ventricosum TaxID=4639 RepID=A0AAV8Q0G7_ENSVE|nr:hypothetical protein OPV22_027566 [Ensete ventricosum]